MRKRWTVAEEEFLKKEYGKKQAEDVARELGRSKSSVCSHAAGMGLDGRPNRWTKEEEDFLRDNYLEMGADAVAEKLGRTASAIHTKIREVGGGRESIGPRVDWDDTEIEFLRENYQEMSWELLEEKLGRTKQAISARAQIIGIKKYIDPYPFFEEWTEESAYAIGFFAADGWVLKRGPESIRVGFSQKDPDIIYALRETIGAGRISTKSNGMHEYYIQSIRIYRRLCEIFGHDVHRKSRTLQWPTVPDKYVRHFMRGAFDGDGSIFKQADKWWAMTYTTSSEEFAHSWASTLLRLTGIEMGIGINKIGVYHARCVGIKAVCLAAWLYGDQHIALGRKNKLAHEAVLHSGIAREYSITERMHGMFPEIMERYEITP